MKRIFNYTNFSIVLSIAIMTVFLIVLVNQELINQNREREFNNFFGEDSRRISINSQKRKFEFDITNLSENYVIYDLLNGSAEKNYMMDSARVVYGEGNFPIPPIKEGRFFTAEELLSEEALCVVGQTTFERSVYTKTIEQTPSEKVFDGSTEYYFMNAGVEYKVIGIFGMEKTSDIDTIVMLNFGGYRANGGTYTSTYMIDSYNIEQIDAAFEALAERVVQTEGTWREIAYASPIKSVDPYYTYLYRIGFLILVLNIFIVSFRYAAKSEYEMCVKKLLGATSFRLAAETCTKFSAIAFVGMGIGIGLFYALSKTQFFESSGLEYFAGITWQTILSTAVIVYLVSLLISVFPLIRIYKLDTSAQIRG